MEIPSQEEVFAFAATVRATWHVTDPIAAVRLHANDPGVEVRHYLERQLRELGRNYKPENAADAERGINLELGGRQLQVSEALLVTQCDVVLKLEADTAAHVASSTLAAREQDRLDQIRQIEIVKHELEKQRIEHQYQLDALKERYELARKQERVEFYADAIRSGSDELIALRLAEHAEDIKDVIQLIAQQRQVEFERRRDLLKMLLEHASHDDLKVNIEEMVANFREESSQSSRKEIESIRIDKYNDES